MRDYPLTIGEVRILHDVFPGVKQNEICISLRKYNQRIYYFIQGI